MRVYSSSHYHMATAPYHGDNDVVLSLEGLILGRQHKHIGYMQNINSAASIAELAGGNSKALSSRYSFRIDTADDSRRCENLYRAGR